MNTQIEPANQAMSMGANRPQWVTHQLNLRKWMDGWVDDMIMNHGTMPWRHGHDEGIFTRTLPAFYMLSGYAPALEFSQKLCTEFIDSPLTEACDCFLTKEDMVPFKDRKLVSKWHGYQEEWSCLCHGPENFSWFLAHLAHISKDPKYIAALEDYAEHLGNWSPEVPDWYNWEEHRFVSCHLGTKVVRAHAPYDYDSDTHIRAMTVAMNAYSLTGNQRYLDLVVNWMEKWADLIMKAGPEGFRVKVYPVPDEQVEGLYGEFGSLHTTTVEYQLGHMMLDIVRAGASRAFLEPVKKMIALGIDRHDWAMGQLIAKYRMVSGDTQFDQTVLDYAETAMSRDAEIPGFIVTINPPSDSVYEGNDFITVGKDSAVTKDERSVSWLACAYQISGDERYINSSMYIAWMRFWAGWYLWDGRQFGCRGSWTGRNGFAMHNVIPALLMGATGGFGMVEGEAPWFEVTYRGSNGEDGLPEGVATLFNPAAKTIAFANTTTQPQTVRYANTSRTLSPLTKPVTGDDWSEIDIPADGLMVVPIPS